jgi:hypothetical protein
MPGIFGIVDPSARTSSRRLHELMELTQQMSAAMRYEPRYSADVVAFPEYGACVGRVGDAAGEAPRPADLQSAALVSITTGEPSQPSLARSRGPVSRRWP